DYQAFATATFTLVDGVHTLSLAGLTAGDNTALLDLVAVAPNADGVAAGGFEGPAGGTGFQSAPSGPAGSYAAGAGGAGNGSVFTTFTPPAPEGTQVAFLQS